MILLQYLNLRSSNKFIFRTCKPSFTQQKFIKSFSLFTKTDEFLTKKFAIKIEDILIVKTYGFQVFHFFLQLESAMNFLHFNGTRNHQFNFLMLNDFCDENENSTESKKHGINFIKFCFLVSNLLNQEFLICAKKLDNQIAQIDYLNVELPTFQDIFSYLNKILNQKKTHTFSFETAKLNDDMQDNQKF